MQLAIVPKIRERNPKETISSRLSGTILAHPPMRIPRLPGLANPHKLYVIMMRLLSLSVPGDRRLMSR